MSTKTNAPSRASTASKAFQELKGFFPAVIGEMPRPEFTSHEFIRELAHVRQKEYVQALCRYSKHEAPFQTLHSLISQTLAKFPHLVERLPDVESKDLFGQPGKCAAWRKTPGS
jgi:hypothetical protein